MSGQINDHSENDGEDQELQDLLDSAIADFDKPQKVEKKVEVAKPELSAQEVDDKWSEEFLVEVQKQFEQNMKNLLGQEALEEGASVEAEEFSIQLRKLAEEAGKVLNDQARNPEFSETIAQTLKNLSDNAENIDTEMAPDNLSAIMEGLNLGNADFSNEMVPLIQSVMKSFISKDIMYGPIKEITEKYPAWLKNNKKNLEKKDYESFDKQFHLMEEVCKEFEEESDSDSEEIKNKRFTKVLALMEEMQKLGQPPKDLVGENNPFGLDESGLASQLPGLDQSQCAIM